MTADRWSNERLDDMRNLVEANDKRLDTVEDLVQAHEQNWKNFGKYGDRRSDRRFNLLLAAATWALALAAIIVSLITGGHPA